MNIEQYVKQQVSLQKNKGEISFKYMVNDLLLSSYGYLKSGADRLFVMLNGAVAENTATETIYHRYSWHPLFPGHVLYISDPTLYKYGKYGLSLSWYMGDKYTPLYPFLIEFIKNVAISLGVTDDRIIFYGSSGGGFSALQLASYMHSNSLAVCINPQTNILYYEDKFVHRFLSSCFSASMLEKEHLSQNERFNAIKNVKSNNTKVLYIQNSTDKSHVVNHFMPFITELEIKNWTKTFSVDIENTSRVQVLWYTHDSGHAAEPKEKLPEIISAISYMLDDTP